MTGFTVDVQIALADGERMTRRWWEKRYEHGVMRAGGMPPEVIDAQRAGLRRQTDPDTGDRFACVTLSLAPGIGQARATEVAHTLSSVLVSEGYTLRLDGQRIDTLSGESDREPQGELGGLGYTEARVCSERCLNCVMASDSRWGCCGEGAAFSLADIGAALVDDDTAHVERILALPGEMDGVKWHPHLSGGRCILHDPSKGCTLPQNRMPLQCRTYLCAPEKLLSPAVLADYTGYVDALEEAEAFIEEHMRQEGGVEFGSPLEAVKEAAVKAFAAWEAGKGAPAR